MDPQLLLRSVKSCSLDVHPRTTALVLNYDLQATVLGQLGDAMLGERSCLKLIHVKNLGEDTDVRALAWSILEQVPLIPEAKVSEVQHLLQYLKNRSQNHNSTEQDSTAVELSAPPAAQDEVSLANIEQYVELLYDDLRDKLSGASLILQLAQNQDNLKELQYNEAALGALARVLREDWKHSIQLSTTILSVFNCFSRFSEFHWVVSQFKVGAQCMTLMEQELKRFQIWTKELRAKLQDSEKSPQDQDLRKDLEKNQRKFTSLVQKQDQLLTVAVSLLLNLSENLSVQIKMCQKNIVSMLVRLLDRADLLLLQATVRFLKNLSVFVENKNNMAVCGVVPRLVPLVRAESGPVLLDSILRLLLNLTFDLELRTQMVQTGLIPRLSALLGLECHRQQVLRVLYQLSLDVVQRALFSLTDCIPKLMQFLAQSPQDQDLDSILVSLCINLSLDPACAPIFCGGLQMLLSRAVKTTDVLLMKMVRNLSQHQETTSLLVEHMETMLSQISEQQDQTFVLEVLGTVSNLRLWNLDWSLVLDECKNLLPFLMSRLIPDAVEDHVVLEVVLMIQTLSSDQGCAEVLSNARVVPALLHLLNERQTDDEFVCQIVFAFYHLAFHKETRDDLLRDQHISMFLLNLMHDTNPEVRCICDQTLDILAASDESWFQKVRMERFLRHNASWLKMIQDQDLDLLMFSPRPEEPEEPELLCSPPDELLSVNRCLTPDFIDLGHVFISSSSKEALSVQPGFTSNEGFFLNLSNQD